MDRRVYYYKQPLASAELNAAFAAAEDADRHLAAEAAVSGVVSGLVLSQTGPASLNTSLTAGTAYDKAGVRMAVVGGQTVPVGVDESNATTAVSGSGNIKWVSVFLSPNRTQSDPRTDGNGASVYFVNAETYKLRVVQGTEGTNPARPALHASDILLADIRRAFGVSTILDGAIYDDRTENVFSYIGTTLSATMGSARAALANLYYHYDLHVQGSTDRHAGSTIDYAGGSNWAEGSANPAGNLEDTIDNIIFALRSVGGAAKLGASGPLGATAIQGALNAIEARATAAYTATIPYVSVTRLHPLNEGAVRDSAWTIAPGGLTQYANANTYTDVPLHLPNGVTISNIAIKLTPNTGHGALPQFKPSMTLYRVAANGATTQLGSVITDAPVNVAGYETAHDLSSAYAVTTDTSTYTYFLRLVGESGTNWITGLYLGPARLTLSGSVVDIVS